MEERDGAYALFTIATTALVILWLLNPRPWKGASVTVLTIVALVILLPQWEMEITELRKELDFAEQRGGIMGREERERLRGQIKNVERQKKFAFVVIPFQVMLPCPTRHRAYYTNAPNRSRRALRTPPAVMTPGRQRFPAIRICGQS